MKNNAAWFRRISLKYKLMLALVLLPTVTLGLYLVLASKVFVQDKMAYVYDATSSSSRTLAAQVRAEMGSLASTVRVIIQGYDLRRNKFSDFSQKLFTDDSRLYKMSVYSFVNGIYRRAGELTSKDKEKFYESKDPADDVSEKAALELIRKTGNQELAIRVSTDKQWVFFAIKLGDPRDPKTPYIVVVGKSPEVFGAFDQVATYLGYLVDAQGKVILAPKGAKYKISNFGEWEFFKKMKTQNLPEGVTEVDNKAAKGRLLVSYSRTGVSGLIIISTIDKSAALEAMTVLLYKSILFFVALISFSTMVSVVAARSLTRALTELYKGAQKVAAGDFSIRIKNKAGDEIGILTQSFNLMTEKVASLLTESVDKARMEKELETAKTVQNTLFPAPQFHFGGLRGAGIYEPASECGGDWWNYGLIGKYLYIWLGDATGHGAAAALITSAAKSAATVIEELPDMSTAAAMEYLNKAIYQTSKGSMMMTFFLAAIDCETGDMSYTTASHDPPYLFKKKNEPLTRKDLILLQDKIDSRLGESAAMSYQQCDLKLEAGDSIIFYTDGIIAVEDKEKKKWGERTFVNVAVKALNEKSEPADVVQVIGEKIKEHRKDSALPDDITLIVCRFDEVGRPVDGVKPAKISATATRLINEKVKEVELEFSKKLTEEEEKRKAAEEATRQFEARAKEFLKEQARKLSEEEMKRKTAEAAAKMAAERARAFVLEQAKKWAGTQNKTPPVLPPTP